MNRPSAKEQPDLVSPISPTDNYIKNTHMTLVSEFADLGRNNVVRRERTHITINLLKNSSPPDYATAKLISSDCESLFVLRGIK